MYWREMAVWLIFVGSLGVITGLACTVSIPDEDDDGSLSYGACVTEGGCEQRHESQCGGEFQGHGSICPATGACCVNGSCSEETQDQCLADGGVYRGDDTVCTPDLCPTGPLGACCFFGSPCEQLTEIDCAGLGGLWSGPEGDCAVCDTTGACCLVDGSCVPDVTLAECVFVFGGASCESCPAPVTGACCSGEGCEQVSEAECSVAGGDYKGDSTRCDQGPCVQGGPTGACCLIGLGVCQELTEAECFAQNGRYRGDNTLCEPGACAGLCCLLAEEACATLEESECNNLGGAFYGPGFSCDMCPFPPGARGACLVGPGLCIQVAEAGCTGQFLGVGTLCPPANGGGGGVPGSALACEKRCMERVSSFLAACTAQGNATSVCAPVANQLFEDCLGGCAASCDQTCMTRTSDALTVCITFGTPLETCLSAAQGDFGACLSTCPPRCETECLDGAASQLTDCLVGGGDPVECGKRADALITSCLTSCLPPVFTTPQLSGDCNQDGGVNTADVVCLINLLFSGFNLIDRTTPVLPCETRAGDVAVLDVSANEAIDVADIVALANFLFDGGPLPPGGAVCRVLDAELGCPQNAGCR